MKTEVKSEKPVKRKAEEMDDEFDGDYGSAAKKKGKKVKEEKKSSKDDKKKSTPNGASPTKRVKKEKKEEEETWKWYEITNLWLLKNPGV